MRDRITELESAVSRLEANVDGLREQLVEANERIRQLERDLAAELVDESAAQRLRDEPRRPEDGPTEDEDAGSEPEPEGDTDDSAEDIIVA